VVEQLAHLVLGDLLTNLLEISLGEDEADVSLQLAITPEGSRDGIILDAKGKQTGRSMAGQKEAIRSGRARCLLGAGE
jgi:hypothetical protein